MGTSSDPDASIAGDAARATAGLAPGGLDWARELDALAERFLDAGGPAGYAGTPLDAAIAVRRLAIGQLAPGLGASAGLDLRNNLAVDLASRYQAAGGLDDLLESCTLSRAVLAGAAPGDLLAAAAGLAGRLSLLARHPGYENELDDPPVRMGDVGVGVLGARAHVVLSACDAALTADSLPDEALSPAAAFLLAGAGTVTAPVWPVDDETASGFMVNYHRALAAGAEPGQALSQVQAAWSARRPAFDYAPWVVVLRPRGTAAP